MTFGHCRLAIPLYRLGFVAGLTSRDYTVFSGRQICHLTWSPFALYLHYLVRRRTGTEFAISGSFNFEHSGHRATKTVGITTSPGILLSTATDLLAPFGSR